MRPTWDEYFISVARLAASRSTCLRLSVGCVLVVNKQIIATGYNGSAPGQPHCTDAGCYLDGESCQRTIHAEVNALGQAARRGVAVDGATAYVTHTPCLHCGKAMAAAGVRLVVIETPYGGHATLLEELYGLETQYV
ncbi:MAG: cytidine/deoxycytidylate deaminase family protein [Actinobacteria bacterium]|nr:cytidine/deoxycytidylate deaminase family protein [Actinomycetota bacterium]